MQDAVQDIGKDLVPLGEGLVGGKDGRRFLIPHGNELVVVDVVGRESVLCCHKAEGGGQMGLAHTGRPKEYHVLSILQKAHGGQLVNLALIDGGREGKVKVVQSLLD